jgi:hypothetical protein
MRTSVSSTLRQRLKDATDAQRLAMLRIAVGTYAFLFLFIRSLHLWNAATYPPSRWKPVGILVPLTSAPAPWIFRSLLLLSLVVGVGFVTGWRYRLTGPVFAVLFLLVTTFRFSWGSVLHTEHLVVIHLLLIGFSQADHAWALRQSHTKGRAHVPKSTYTWAIQTCAVATVIGYTVSGIAKLRYGGWDWISGDVLRNQIAFDNLRKITLGDIHSPLAGWIINNDAPLKIFAPFSVFLEIAAPAALLHSLFRTVWVLGIWLFHVAVLALMAIVFPYQLLAIAYLPLLLMTPLLQTRPRRNDLSHGCEPQVPQRAPSTSN